MSSSSKPQRRVAREEALQILYQLDLNSDLSLQAALYRFELCFTRQGPTIDEFTHRLITGVSVNREDLDKLLEGASQNWRLDRMPTVDRSILRLGAFELAYCDDIPATVTINESIELAKSFGSENSAPFINGILDRVWRGLDRPAKAP